MLSIQLDISEVVDEYRLLLNESKNLGNRILDKAIEIYRDEWEKMVSNELHQTKREYLQAIEVDRISDFKAVIKLTDRESKLPLMLEEGASPFDIKEGLMKGKTKTSSGGKWYVDVPFLFATTQKMAQREGFNAGAAPGSVINRAKKAGGRAVTQGQLFKKYQEKKTRKEIRTGIHTIPSYTHQQSIYAGIRRKEVGTSKKSTGQYRTFRRVSAASDKFSWIHKGFEARKFMDRALKETEVNIENATINVIDEFLDEIR